MNGPSVAGRTRMLIRLGYDIELDMAEPRVLVAALSVHPSRTADLLEPDELRTSDVLQKEEYTDSFGNRCTRMLAPSGTLRLYNSTLIRDSGEPDPVNPNAKAIPVELLPTGTLQFLLPSRYCEVDQLSALAWSLFAFTPPGWPRVQAICDWVHNQITFGYQHASPTRTALEGSIQRVGVCRDFQHLAISLCRAMHIPARYATGYLGDIGAPADPNPMDFSAWFEVWLEDSHGNGRWWTFDARHNKPRIGRVLMATGRDAADVAITTSFGTSGLRKFSVVTEEVIVQSENAEIFRDSAGYAFAGNTGDGAGASWANHG
jgi:transglutaminase-like putative cysteine protease